MVEPTLSLISDQVQKLRNRHIPAGYITGLNHAEHRQIYRDLNRGRISILYMTPEKVATVDFQLATQENPPWLVVIDEVHVFSTGVQPSARPIWNSGKGLPG